MADRQWTVQGVQISEKGEEDFAVQGVQIRQDQAAAVLSGHPTMRRWGGVPHMTPGPVLAGRSW